MRPQEFDDYVDYLHAILLERNSNNPSYSLRAFARDLKISPARLSEVMRSKGNISPSKAKTFLDHICDDQESKDYFYQLVLSKVARNENQRNEAKKYIKHYALMSQAKNIIEKDFEKMSEWYFLGIWNFIGFSKRISFEQILTEFPDLSQDSIKQCLSTLVRLELVGFEKNVYVKIINNLSAFYEFSSFAVQKYHKSMMSKAIECLNNDPVNDRYFYSRIERLGPEQYKKFTKDLTKLWEAHALECEESTSSEGFGVYALNFQCFRLNKSKEYVGE